jgi:hypothetical protein
METEQDAPKTGGGGGEEEQLEGEVKTEYQSMSARLNYLAMDRADLQFGVKELMRKMAGPTKKDWKALKRVARYCLGAPRIVQKFDWSERANDLIIHVDSDFAGCQTTRKSTSGGCISWGKSTLKTWSKTQSVIALSSGEAELAAMIRGATEAMGMQSVLKDFGIWVKLVIRSDASAAIGMVKREGLGKVRHLAVADLWIQEKRARGEMTFEKVDGEANPADMMTKGVNGEKIERFCKVLGFEKKEGRHEQAPEFREK